MPTQKTIPEILQLQKISQYLASNDVSQKNLLKAGALNPQIPRMIFMEGKIIQWVYDVNPDDTALRGTANYLYDILGKYGLRAQARIANMAGTRPTVTGPSDASVAVGETATFTIAVVSTLSYTIKWYRDGVLIVGATGLSYSFVAQEADDGATFNAIATNSAGARSSRVATLEVTEELIGDAYYGATNYYSELNNGIDNVPYQLTFPITDGESFSVTYPTAAQDNKNLVIRVPVGQPVKTTWFNTVLNSGTIPDQVLRDVITIGAYRYYVSRDEISNDFSGAPNFILS